MIESRLIIDECRAALRSLPDGCAQTCVTSPPYFGLRCYGIPPVLWADGTTAVLGLEPTPELFIAHLVEVFREVRRVLRDDGTLWVNLGDSYAQDTKWGGSTGGKHAKGLHGTTGIGRCRTTTGRKAGELCNMPHRVAEALSDDGWYWRSTIVWAKRSCMPEVLSGWRWRRCRVKVAPQVKGKQNGALYQARSRDMSNGVYLGSAVWLDCPGCPKCESNGGYVLRKGKWRPTTAHEYIFMFGKSERYFADGDAVAELAVGGSPGNKTHRGATAYINGDRHMRTKLGLVNMVASEQRNPRSVYKPKWTKQDVLWLLRYLNATPRVGTIQTLSSEPFKGCHFAVFPTELPRRCIEAATSKAGCCPVCEASYAPVVESERVPTRPGEDSKVTGDRLTDGNRDPERHVAVNRVTGYRPTCNCNAGEPIPSLVLDPFAGSGTTLQVARALGRRWIGAEINPDYAALAEKRIHTPPRWQKPKRPAAVYDEKQTVLFP